MNPKFLVLSILSSLRSSDKLISKNVARKLRRELESGRTLKGRRTLTDAERQARVNRLKAYEGSLTKVVKKHANEIVGDAHTTRDEFRGNFQNIEQKLKKLDGMDEKLDKVLRFVSRKATAEDLGDHSSRELYDQYMADLENVRYLKSLVAPQASAEKSMAKKIATADLKKKAQESPEVMEKLRQGQIQSDVFQYLLQDKRASRQVQKPSASEEFLEAATSGRACSSAPPAAALTEQAAILANVNVKAPVKVEPVEEPAAAKPPVKVEPVEEPTAAKPPLQVEPVEEPTAAAPSAPSAKEAVQDLLAVPAETLLDTSLEVIIAEFKRVKREKKLGMLRAYMSKGGWHHPVLQWARKQYRYGDLFEELRSLIR